MLAVKSSWFAHPTRPPKLTIKKLAVGGRVLGYVNVNHEFLAWFDC